MGFLKIQLLNGIFNTILIQKKGYALRTFFYFCKANILVCHEKKLGPFCTVHLAYSCVSFLCFRCEQFYHFAYYYANHSRCKFAVDFFERGKGNPQQ